MTVFSVVRLRVKDGREKEFLEAHGRLQPVWPGLLSANLIKTDERSFCAIAEWVDVSRMMAARPHINAAIETFRDTLEDWGGDAGAIDRVFGPVVQTLK